MSTDQWLEITVGIPACGKSTYANERKELEGDIFVSERDLIRAYLSEGGDINKYKFSKARESRVTETQKSQIEEAIRYLGMSVIVADTNCKQSSIDYFKAMAEGLGVEFRIKHFDTPLRECVKRNLKRHATVPESVLIRMEKERRKIAGQYVWDKDNPDNLPEVVICDLDGTLFDMKGVRGPFEWDKVHLDKPRKFVCEVVNSVMFEGEVKVIFFSGRDEICREKSIQALQGALSAFARVFDKLYMRKEGSNANDCEVKEEMFDKYVKGKYHVVQVIDDRKQVCQMWESMGLPVMNVGGFLADF